MKALTIGKLRGLQRISSSQATFTCLALDHRQNLRRALDPAQPEAVTDDRLSRFKLEVAASLAEKSTAVLLDPEFSAAQAVAAGILPGSTGLVVAVESTGYGGQPTARSSQILPGWSVEKARRMGADAVKLLVYYHPESTSAPEIETFVRQVASDCQKADLVLMLEPLSYSLIDGKKLNSPEKRRVVVETARRLTPLGVDVLKAEFPLDISSTDAVDQDEGHWGEACGEISAASVAPWILLSAAAEYEVYLRQTVVACRAGASGAAVGRAVWQEAVGLDGSRRSAFLQDVGRMRLERICRGCSELGRPWTHFYSADAPFDWYQTY